MKKVSLITIGLVLFVFNSVMAVEMPQGILDKEIQTIKSTTLSSQEFLDQDDDVYDEFAADEDLYKYEFKSPKRAFLQSLLIPGWGQYYSKSHPAKIIGFLGAEVALWFGYFKFHNDGNKLTDEFEAFADAHWIEGDRDNPGPYDDDQNYWEWFYYYANETPDSIPGNETLPETRTQQYYEMIGKYDQFAGGWEDYWDPEVNADPRGPQSGLTFLTPMRQQYETMRNDANNKLDQANDFIIYSMAVHLISAIDAALAANRFNKSKTGDNWLSIKAEMKRFSAYEEVPIVRLTYHFK